MKKISILFILFALLATTLFVGTKAYAAGAGKVWAIHYDQSTGWPFPGRKGDMNTFQVGWDLGIQTVNFTPGNYPLTIIRKETGATIYSGTIYVSSKSVRNFFLFAIPQGYAGYSYIVKLGTKIDRFKVVN